MPPVGFQPTIPASERPQTHALDRAATGTGNVIKLLLLMYNINSKPNISNPKSPAARKLKTERTVAQFNKNRKKNYFCS